ncbi:hypothetical protein BH24DEI1_BH24DEI1_00420 [soil metagenome]|jgi:hypothetical protein|nr:UPF0175 family protein [Deinococcota bacterium]
MIVQLEIPEVLHEALGPEPQKEVLEAILLKLINDDRLSIGMAGKILGLDRLGAIQWYTGHGHHYPNIDAEDFAHDLNFANRK